MRWLIGCVTDWTALFQQAYKALKPGGWIESFECNGFFESDDGTVPDDSAMAQWGILFREGAKKLGSTASFSVPRDGTQRKSLEEAGFINIQEKGVKVRLTPLLLSVGSNWASEKKADMRILQIPICGWPKDPKQREIGQYTRAAIENDIEGTVGFSALQLGWTKEEVMVYAAHLRKEMRSGNLHGYFRSNIAWAQKPAAL